MTPQDIITAARYLVNDTDAVAYRAPDAELLGYVNDGLKEIAVLAPRWFFQIGDLTCLANEAEQVVSFDDALAFVEVVCIHDGPAVLPMDVAVMNAFRPSWRTDPPAAAVNWAPVEKDPRRFWVYPPAPFGQVLDVKYVKRPAQYGLTDVITDVPDAFLPALADYVVYRAESKDDEHVNSNRAAAHYNAFVAKVKEGG